MANYLYNGVELPELPEWDKETYPYAGIALLSLDNNYYLSAFAVKPYVNSAKTWLMSPSAQTYKSWTLSDDGASWVAIEDVSITSTIVSLSIASQTWVNWDLLTENGTLFLAASYPVSVNAGISASIVTERNGDGMAIYGATALPCIDGIWDKAKYPYAIISKYTLDSIGLPDAAAYGCLYEVFFVSKAFSYNTEENRAMVSGPFNSAQAMIASTDALCEYLLNLTGQRITATEWLDQGTWDTGPDQAYSLTRDMVMWTSSDVRSADGAVYCTASDPFPLDGMTVISWDGTTTGLETSSNGCYYKVLDKIIDPTLYDNMLIAAIVDDKYLVQPGSRSDVSVDNNNVYQCGLDAFVQDGGGSINSIIFDTPGVYFFKSEFNSGVWQETVFAYDESSGSGAGGDTGGDDAGGGSEPEAPEVTLPGGSAYIGDGSGIARSVERIYVGGADGIALAVQKAYIGGENGRAVCWWGGV